MIMMRGMNFRGGEVCANGTHPKSELDNFLADLDSNCCYWAVKIRCNDEIGYQWHHNERTSECVIVVAGFGEAMTLIGLVLGRRRDIMEDTFGFGIA